jgi:hypothetical protein
LFLERGSNGFEGVVGNFAVPLLVGLIDVIDNIHRFLVTRIDSGNLVAKLTPHIREFSLNIIHMQEVFRRHGRVVVDEVHVLFNQVMDCSQNIDTHLLAFGTFGLRHVLIGSNIERIDH